MDELTPQKKLGELLNKYKYALLILAVGLCLMLLPESGEAPAEETPIQTAAEPETMEQMLAQILAQIEGAGKVQVLLSEESGSETFYQTDTESQTGESDASSQSQTVIISDADRNESGLVRRTDPPKYLGAVIVCQGADNANVRLAIVEAVRCATGLGANQISVVKMK